MNAKKTIIRIGRNTLSFTTLDASSTEHKILYRPYVVRGGISMSANLREAFKSGDYLDNEVTKVQILVEAPSLLVPIEQFDEAEKEALYSYSYPAGQEKRVIFHDVLPDLKAVCLYAINKNIDTVIHDRFENGVSFAHAMTPVWRQMHQRSYTGHRNKLYGYLHNKQLEIFSFQKNRFKFCNSFDAANAHDALYYLLYVWKQLRLEREHDELHILGDIPEEEWLLKELKRFLQNAYVIKTEKGMPYDLTTLITHGR